MPPAPSQGRPAIILIVGAILVIALVAFSVYRTTGNRASAPAPAVAAVQQSPDSQAPRTEAAVPQTGGTPAASLPPMASPREDARVPIAPPLPGSADAPPTEAQLASVPRINAGDLLQKLEGNEVTLIDVRDAESYRARHIPGAKHIPLSFIAGEVSYLPKDKPIVTYCT